MGDTDEDQGRLQIAGVDESEQGGSAVGTIGSANLEQLDEAQRDNAELQARIGSMEDQMLTLQRLLTLKDDQIVVLQSALGGEAVDFPVVIDERDGAISASPDLAVDMTDVTEAGDESGDSQGGSSSQAADDGLLSMLMDYMLYGVGVLVIIVLLLLDR